jgi:hypothetical protein
MKHTCEPCGATLSAGSESALVQTLRDHAQKEHQKTFSESETRAMIRGQQPSTEPALAKAGAGGERGPGSGPGRQEGAPGAHPDKLGLGRGGTPIR